MTAEQAKKFYHAAVKENGFFSTAATGAFAQWLRLSNEIRADLSPEERQDIVRRNSWYNPRF
jgi:hypothetical protein